MVYLSSKLWVFYRVKYKIKKEYKFYLFDLHLSLIKITYFYILKNKSIFVRKLSLELKLFKLAV